jgi:2-dehydro-3-deoxygluconokinase
MNAEVVTLGESMVSLVATASGPLAEAGSFDRHVAGAESNVAVGLARLGRRVAYIGRVGDDGFGTAIVRRLRGEGIDVEHLTTDADAPTGLMFRERRALGPAQVVYARTGSAGSRLSPADIDRATDAGVFADARWLHLTGITPALSNSARAATERAIDAAQPYRLTVSLDINLRRRLWSDVEAGPVLAALAARTDVVLGSPDELAVITGRPHDDAPAELAAAVLGLGPRIVVVKLGSGGALLVTRGRVPLHSPANAVPQVLDPVGAGDAFCAGFIDGVLRDGELDFSAALAQANACGAAAVAAIGDIAGLPTTDELARLLAATGHDTLR